MTINVLVESFTNSLDNTYTYAVPKELIADIKTGIRVLVPLGNSKCEGFVLSINDNYLADYDLKEIIEVIDEVPVLNEEMFDLGNFMAKKYLCGLTACFQSMLPSGLKAKKNIKINERLEKYVRLNMSEIEISKFLESSKNEKQKQIVEMLLTSEVKKSSIAGSSINTLIKSGLVNEYAKRVYRLDSDEITNAEKIILTNEQLGVSDEIIASLGSTATYLLHGITGSGKTEVYMRIIDEVLKNKKEVIVLVPEISLTPQTVARFKSRFGSLIAVLHSGLSAGEKFDEWEKIAMGGIKIVIGARSAIFAPLKNLGLIVIDEEHSTTYKQESNPRYNTIDIAEYRSIRHKCPIILGSATPSLESYARAIKGVYKLVNLKNRPNNNTLPEVKIVDMKLELKKKNFLFSSVLKNEIQKRIDNKEQVILLLNKRGFSTMFMCQECGMVFKCPNCDVSLVYHKTNDMLRCHYCGYGDKLFRVCNKCGGKNILELGAGTQKIEEELTNLFPNSFVVRMDMDTTSKKGSHKTIIKDFKDGKYNILIGTQMISKGLDFPNVTLVGVINGDTSLNIPDFRSSERTFQLLCQVSGRSGRSKKGNVIIQTFNPDNYSINYASSHDYESFFRTEMLIRRKLKYPPYYFLNSIRISSKDYEILSKESNIIGNYLKNNVSEDTIILGPTTANPFKVNNVFTFSIIIKYKIDDKLMSVLREIVNKYIANNKIKVEIDVNPVRF